MATIKHISSKNADYSAAEKYLLFEHDEHTQKVKTDSAGRTFPVIRRSLRRIRTGITTVATSTFISFSTHFGLRKWNGKHHTRLYCKTSLYLMP